VISSVVNYSLYVLDDLNIVPVTGQVTTSAGRPIRNVEVVFTDQSGMKRRTITNAFGYYFFPDLVAGQTYTVSLSSKLYTFAPQTVTIIDATVGLDIVAAP